MRSAELGAMGHGTGSQVGNHAPRGERQIGTESEHRLGIRPTWAHTTALTLKTAKQTCMNSLRVRERERHCDMQELTEARHSEQCLGQ